MIPFATSLFMATGSSPNVSYVGGQARSNQNTTATLGSLGAQDQDYLLVFANSPLPQINGVTVPGLGVGLFGRKLVSADLAYGVFRNSTSDEWGIAIWRGQIDTIAAFSSFSGTTGGGGTKDAKHGGFIALTDGPAGITGPSTWTQRVAIQPGGYVYDRLYPANTTYIDGTDFTVSGTTPTTIYEIRIV